MGQVYQLPRAQHSAVLDTPEAFWDWENRTPDAIDVKRSYLQVAGDDKAAGLLLSQLAFRFKPLPQGQTSWWLVQHANRLWFPKRREDWQAECRLSPKEFDRASNVLVERGLIAKKRFRYRGSPVVHISLNVETLASQVEALGFPQRENGISPNGKMEFPQTGKSLRKTSLKIQNPDLPPTPLIPQLVATSPTQNSGFLRTKDEDTETPSPKSPKTEDPFEALYLALPDDHKVILEEKKRTELIAQGYNRDFLTAVFLRGAIGRDLAAQAGGAMPGVSEPSAGASALSLPRPTCESPSPALQLITPEIPPASLAQPRLSEAVLPTPQDLLPVAMTDEEYLALPADLKARLEDETRAQLGQAGSTRHLLPLVYVREATRRRLTTPAGSPLPEGAAATGNASSLAPSLPAEAPPTPPMEALPTRAGEKTEEVELTLSTLLRGGTLRSTSCAASSAIAPTRRSSDVQAKAALPSPTWSDIKLVDLQDTGRLLTVYHQCVRLGWIGASPHDRHTFVSLAEHVLERVQLRDCANPGGLFRSLLRKPDTERDRFVSDGDEDAASKRLRDFDYGRPPSPPVETRQLSLSKDAWIVREVQRTAARHGIHGDIFAQLRREDPVRWTIEHCETIARELAAYAQTCQQGAALSRLGEVNTGGARPGERCAECGEDRQACICLA